jgi:5-methylcytosine-specific restriction endonuclease McrA
MIDHSEFLEQHSAYLASPQWHERRDAVLARDRGRCQARLEVCTSGAQQVHHLSYRHWRNEPLFELIAVCSACHDEITRMDRGATLDDILVGRRAKAQAAARQELERLKELLARHGDALDDPSRALAYRNIAATVDDIERRLAEASV